MEFDNKTVTATYREIMQQPDVWLKAYDLVCKNEEAINSFISRNHLGEESEIILTGAGTSAFIGNVFFHEVAHRLPMLAKAPEQRCIFGRSERQVGKHAGQQA